MQNNRIGVLTRQMLLGIDNVLTVSLSGNPLYAIENSTFCSKSSLKNLDISNNSIPVLNPDVFSCITSLETLYINNPTFFTCDDTLKPFTKWVSTPNNPLQNKGRLVCKQPDYMTGFSINQISTVNLVSGGSTCPTECDCLTAGTKLIVDCSSKDLQQVPEDIPSNTIELLLQNNQIYQLISNNFIHLPNLEYLSLQSSKVATIETNSLNNLRNLKQLYLQDNDIVSLPISGFGELTSLEVLYMQNNRIGVLTRQMLLGIDNVIEVSFSGNPIYAIENSTFCSKSSLKALDISRSAIPVLDQSGFTCITSLEKLYINNPKLLRCDASFKSFKNWASSEESPVQNLDQMICTEPSYMKGFSINTFSEVNLVSPGSCPDGCSCFSSVVDCSFIALETIPNNISPTTTDLNLQFNQINELTTNQFIHLPNLRHLNLQSNNGLSNIDAGAFNNLRKLKTLNMEDNSIVILPPAIFWELTSLNVLNLQNNRIGLLTKQMMLGLDNIIQLSFSGNPIYAIENSTFCSKFGLQNLDLSRNELLTYKAEYFSCLPNLQQLYLNDPENLVCNEDLKDFKKYAESTTSLKSQNLIECSTPEYMSGLAFSEFSSSNLVSLGSCPEKCSCFADIVDCSEKGLSSVPEGISPDTKELFLQNNLIEGLEINQFIHLQDLERLYLHGNNIKTMASSSFTSAAKLQQLTLHDNDIEECPDSLLAGLDDLKAVNMNNNKLTELGGQLLENSDNVVEFSVNNNQLESLDGNIFDGLTELKYLGLGKNKLSSVPDFLGESFANAYLIDYSSNRLTKVPKPPSNVQLFYVMDNPIETIQAGVFEKAKSLYQFFATDCQISSIENDAWQGADNLGWILLEGNSLKSIESSMFSGLTKLEAIFLTGNSELSTIETESMTSSAETLRRLLLDNCKLSNLDPNFLKKFTNDDFYVWLGGNPWNCDCNLQDLSDYATQIEDRIVDGDSFTCQSPASLSGQLVLEAELAECDNTGGGDENTSPPPDFSTTTTRKTTTTPDSSDDEDVVDDDESSEVNSALIISLSIVGAVVLFAALSCFVYKKGSKAARNLGDLSDSSWNDNEAFENKEGHYKDKGKYYSTAI